MSITFSNVISYLLFFYLRANQQSPLHVVFVFNPYEVIENGSKQAVWELIELKT